MSEPAQRVLTGAACRKRPGTQAQAAPGRISLCARGFLILMFGENPANMQSIPLGVSSLKSSRLAYGCWRVAGSWNPADVTPESRVAGCRALVAAYEAGYTLFDNADIYC